LRGLLEGRSCLHWEKSRKKKGECGLEIVRKSVTRGIEKKGNLEIKKRLAPKLSNTYPGKTSTLPYVRLRKGLCYSNIGIAGQ